MSIVALTLNKNEVNFIERPVTSVTVGTGTLVVTPLNGDPVVAKEGESVEVGDTSVTILALEGSNYSADYTHPTGTEAPVLPREVPATTVPRGDAGGSTGSFESRTVEELQELAAKRNIKGRSKMDKDALIEALRG